MDRRMKTGPTTVKNIVHNVDLDSMQQNSKKDDTDTNIFALGEAAGNLDEDLDDIFAGFGVNLADILQDGAPGTITTTKLQVPPKRVGVEGEDGGGGRGVDGHLAELGEPSGGTVSVSTISQKLDNGKSVHTRVIKGPVRCKKKLMKITRDTPNGPEIIAEVEAEPGMDMNQILADVLPRTLGLGNRASVYADYDNLNPIMNKTVSVSCSSSREETPERPDEPAVFHTESEVSAGGGPGEVDTGLKDKSQLLVQPVAPQSHQANHQSNHTLQGNHILPPPSPTHSKEKKTVFFDEQTDVVPQRRESRRLSKPKVSPLPSPSRRKSLAPLPEEDNIQLYQPPETDEDESGSDSSKTCLICTSRKRRKHKQSFGDSKKGGGGGMTQLHDDPSKDQLPGIKALVANYARMLHEERDQFVETLFRAVKLNNVDVTRILCKIVSKSGFKLSHFDLREPESSATILHVALLYNHPNIIKVLLGLKDRDLILAKYETEQYHNQTGLHVAVANGNPELIESILLALEPHDRVVLINLLADGKYFRTQHPHGQLCLTAACWAGNDEVIKTLVRYGGQLSLKNHNGNTLLHSLILQSVEYINRCNYEGLLDSIWESCGIQAEQMTILYDDAKYAQQRQLRQKELHEEIFKDLLIIRNNDGYTPLALACTLSSCLFKYMINMETIFKIPQNKLGSIAWVTYDVTAISSFSKEKYNKFSILHILAHNSQHLSRGAQEKITEDFLELQPVSALIDSKWSVYRWVYIFWMVVHLTYMIIFTACTASTNSKPKMKTEKNMDETGHFKEIEVEIHYWLAVFVILPTIYLFLESLDMAGIKPYRMQMMSGQNYLKRCIKNVKSEWTITGNGPYRLVNFGFSSFTIQWFILYLQEDDMQDLALSMSLLLGWIFVLFFTRACRVTCRFTIMIQKMFFRDLIYFLTVYGIILIAFSFAMNALFNYLGDADNNINKVFYDMMNVVTDLDQKQSIDSARHPMFAKLLLILYAIIAVILLMNMLIAMMNTSYETVRATRCNLYKSQQLSILLLIERRFFWLKWLTRASEKQIWTKEVNDEMRTFIDITMLHHAQGKQAKPGQRSPKREAPGSKQGPGTSDSKKDI